jgi:hypothetical protein
MLLQGDKDLSPLTNLKTSQHSDIFIMIINIKLPDSVAKIISGGCGLATILFW